MGDAIRVFLCQFRHRFQLLRIHTAKWDFDTLHTRRVPDRIRTFRQFRLARWKRQGLRLFTIPALTVVVTLTVCAATQASLSK